MESAGVGTHTSGGVNSAWEGWEMRGCDACEVPGDTQPHWFREPGRVGGGAQRIPRQKPQADFPEPGFSLH